MNLRICFTFSRAFELLLSFSFGGEYCHIQSNIKEIFIPYHTYNLCFYIRSEYRKVVKIH